MNVSPIATTTSASAKHTHFWPRELALGLLPLLVGLQLLVSVVYLPLGLRGVADLRQLYTGGYMIRTGEAKNLYDYHEQEKFEEELVPVGVHFMLPINHPAYEELLFVPLSLVKYRSAYWIFIFFNICLLMICLRLLRSRLQVLFERWRWFPALLFAAFAPIPRTLLQGQDSIILLTLLAAALVLLDREKNLAAGFLVGLGVFKFQIAIPIVLLFLIWRCWRFAIGFGISSGFAAAVSCWIVGLGGVKTYLNTLTSMSIHLSSDLDMARYATFPNGMMNLRGLIFSVFAGRMSQLSLHCLILAASLVILLLAASQKPSLPLAITAGSLVSYHFLAHDASVLILPVVLALSTMRVGLAFISVLLLIAPICATVPQYGYLAAIPLLAFFVASLELPDAKPLAVSVHR